VASAGEDKVKNSEIIGINMSRKWEYPEEFAPRQFCP
jgi:hypothetical protein